MVLYRILARFCDYSLFFLFLGAITLFLPYFYGPFFYYFLALTIPFLWAPIEAFFLSKWKTTPGKALFGLKVTGPKGTALVYSSALKWCLLCKSSAQWKQQKISLSRKLTALLTSSAFVLAAIYGNVLSLWSVGLEKGISPSGWVQYSSDDAHFKVSFPTDPETASKELVIPDSGKVLNYKEITTDEHEKVRYSVSHLELPRKWRLAGNTTLLKGVLDVLVQHTENCELLEKEFKVHNQNRVLDYRMKQGKDEMKGRLIIVNGTLYKLTISYPPSHKSSLNTNPFLDSFEIS